MIIIIIFKKEKNNQKNEEADFSFPIKRDIFLLLLDHQKHVYHFALLQLIITAIVPAEHQ